MRVIHVKYPVLDAPSTALDIGPEAMGLCFAEMCSAGLAVLHKSRICKAKRASGQDCVMACPRREALSTRPRQTNQSRRCECLERDQGAWCLLRLMSFQPFLTLGLVCRPCRHFVSDSASQKSFQLLPRSALELGLNHLGPLSI